MRFCEAAVGQSYDNEEATREHIRELMEKDYSIHFHVWTQLDFLEFVLSLRDRLSFEIETMLMQVYEFVIVLRKTAGPDTEQEISETQPDVKASSLLSKSH